MFKDLISSVNHLTTVTSTIPGTATTPGPGGKLSLFLIYLLQRWGYYCFTMFHLPFPFSLQDEWL